MRPKISPRRPKIASTRPQDESRRPQNGPRRDPWRPKMAHEGPRRDSRGLQKGPQDGSDKDLGTDLAESSLQDPPGTLQGPSRDPPGTLLDPSGERCRHLFRPTILRPIFTNLTHPRKPESLGKACLSLARNQYFKGVGFGSSEKRSRPGLTRTLAERVFVRPIPNAVSVQRCRTIPKIARVRQYRRARSIQMMPFRIQGKLGS